MRARTSVYTSTRVRKFQTRVAGHGVEKDWSMCPDTPVHLKRTGATLPTNRFTQFPAKAFQREVKHPQMKDIMHMPPKAITHIQRTLAVAQILAELQPLLTGHFRSSSQATPDRHSTSFCTQIHTRESARTHKISPVAQEILAETRPLPSETA